MPINRLTIALPLPARRVFRGSLVIALALLIAYGMALPLPYLAPLIAVFLSAKPGPALGLKAFFGLTALVILTLGIGLILIPFLSLYPLTTLLIIATGLFFSTYISVHLGKQMVGTLLSVGFTIIPAAGLIGFAVGQALIASLVMSIAITVICQWMVYPLFPEDDGGQVPAVPVKNSQSAWIALRTMLIVIPPYIVALSNPTTYLPLIMKSIQLGQAGADSKVNDDVHSLGRELIGSTLMGGLLAVGFWFLLDIVTNLWMFFLWTLLFSIFVLCKLYQVFASRFESSFWLNTFITLFILLGPAVQDSAAGKDVYKAFFIRMSLFILLAGYAWFTLVVLEQWRNSKSSGSPSTDPSTTGLAS
jgi:hypothetical protein